MVVHLVQSATDASQCCDCYGGPEVSNSELKVGQADIHWSMTLSNFCGICFAHAQDVLYATLCFLINTHYACALGMA